MRTFIAFEFDTQLKRRTLLIQDKLKQLSIKGRWAHADNLHLTLKFLGETSVEQCNKIEEQLSYIMCSVNAIKLTLDHVGYFSGKTDMRVLWIGLKGDIKVLENLNCQIEESMFRLGFNRERRRFNPHITLGRNITLKEDFDIVKEELRRDCDYSFVLNKISFIESRLTEGKRIYTPLKSYSLKSL